MIVDNMFTLRDQENEQGLYWNYFYHVWKTFSASPFANAAVFVAGTPSVTAVTISPSSASVTNGQTVLLTATVTTKNFAPKTVTWSSSNESIATVNIYGEVTAVEGASGSVTITATSTYDTTVSASATITVS